MKPIEFKEQNCVIAKNQPQYLPLPAFLDWEAGTVTCCWGLSLKERLTVLFTGRIWHTIQTFNHPLQPQKLSTENPL